MHSASIFVYGRNGDATKRLLEAVQRSIGVDVYVHVMSAPAPLARPDDDVICTIDGEIHIRFTERWQGRPSDEQVLTALDQRDALTDEVKKCVS